MKGRKEAKSGWVFWGMGVAVRRSGQTVGKEMSATKGQASTGSHTQPTTPRAPGISAKGITPTVHAPVTKKKTESSGQQSLWM